MIAESIIGGLMGGVFRLAPEVLKFMDRKNERSHELSMQAANLESDKAKYANQLAVATVQTEATMFTQATSALQEALRGQFQLTGNAWIDGLNMSVRPVITYFFFFLYAFTKIAAWQAGSSQLWVESDMGLFSGIIAFYFLGRVFDRVSP